MCCVILKIQAFCLNFKKGVDLLKLDRVKVISEMARNDISCKELVGKTGLSRVTVTNVRNGKSCTRSTAFAIAAAIGVDISKITTDCGDSHSCVDSVPGEEYT